jgi:hypothetical protein
MDRAYPTGGDRLWTVTGTYVAGILTGARGDLTSLGSCAQHQSWSRCQVRGSTGTRLHCLTFCRACDQSRLLI